LQVANALLSLNLAKKKGKTQCVIVGTILISKALFKAVIALALQVDDLDVRGSCHQRFNNTLFFIWLL